MQFLVHAETDTERRRRPGDRVAEHFRHRASRAIANRTIFRYLASAMLVLSFGAGVVVWLIDRKDFHTLGDGLWWALVTLADGRQVRVSLPDDAIMPASSAEGFHSHHQGRREPRKEGLEAAKALSWYLSYRNPRVLHPY